jgi:hypothetical protein
MSSAPAIMRSMVLGMSGTSSVFLTLLIIALVVVFILTFVLRRTILFVIRVLLGGALALAVLIAIFR